MVLSDDFNRLFTMQLYAQSKPAGQITKVEGYVWAHLYRGQRLGLVAGLGRFGGATLHVSHIAYLRNCFLLGKQSSAIRSAQLVLDGA